MRRLNDGIRKYHDCFVSPAMRVIPWVPLSVMTKQLRAQVDDMLYTPHPGLPTGGLVSLGHFDLARYSCPGFEASGLFGIPGAVGKLNIVIHNFSDCAELIFSVPARYNGSGQLEAMIERFRADINA